MKIYEIKLRQEFDASVERVWSDFSDHASFGKMMGQNVKRIVDGKDVDDINGIGSVRLIKLPMLSFEETIMKSKKPECIEYMITRGTPLHYHKGKIEFTSMPEGRCGIEYYISLGSKIPLLGGLVAFGLKKGLAAGLANYALRLRAGK